MLYNIHYYIAAIFICFFIIFTLFLRKDISKKQNKVFLLLVYVHLFSLVFGILSPIANSNFQYFSIFFRDLFNYLYLICHVLVPLLFTYYVIFLLSYWYKENRKFLLTVSIPFFISLILILLNPFNRLVFYYNDNNLYTRNIFMNSLYINSALLLSYSLYLIIKFKNALRIDKYISLIIMLFASILPVLIQFIYPYLLIELFFQTLGILGVLLTIENQRELLNNTTKVYNRFTFLNEANSLISSHVPFTIITVKISHINYLNSTFGINYINSILVNIASVLKKLNKNLNVFDCENGHFALLSYESEGYIKLLVRKIQKSLDKKWGNSELMITVSTHIGYIKVLEDVNCIEQLMLIVDMPYFAKKNSSEVVYSYNLDDIKRKFEVEHAISNAIENKTLEVHYQPIWNIKSKKFLSAEALIRLKDPVLGYISPSEFIPIAENNGSILDIGSFVLEEICILFNEYQCISKNINFIEMNLSALELMNQNLANKFQPILNKYNFSGNKINLEITESIAINKTTFVSFSMQNLINLGFSFSLDDYGTGYSNLSQLFELPFKFVKIDKSLLWNAHESKKTKLLFENTIHMFKNLGFTVVVEGVETVEQSEYLSKLGCEYMQGFLYSKPLNKKDFVSLISNEIC